MINAIYSIIYASFYISHISLYVSILIICVYSALFVYRTERQIEIGSFLNAHKYYCNIIIQIMIITLIDPFFHKK